jgi:four helix bundle protein
MVLRGNINGNAHAYVVCMAKSRDLRVRAFGFALDTIRFCRIVARRDPILRRLAYQLTDAAGSIGANLEEAQAGQTKRDFIAKNCIALKEARESYYWLRLIVAVETALSEYSRPLVAESDELIAMLTAAIRSARGI